MKSLAWRLQRKVPKEYGQDGRERPESVFTGKLVRRAAKLGIPLVGEYHNGVVFVRHARRGSDLRELEWEVISHLGAEISTQYRLGARWGGLMMPAVWMMTVGRQGPSAGRRFGVAGEK